MEHLFPPSFYVERLPAHVENLFIVGGPSDTKNLAIQRGMRVSYWTNVDEFCADSTQSDSWTSCDAVLVFFATLEAARAERFWTKAAAALGKNVYLFTAFRSGISPDGQFSPEELRPFLTESGWTLYLTWEARNEQNEVVTIPLCVWVRTHYDPVAHAKVLRESGKPAEAYEILSMIPGERLTEAKANAFVDAEMQQCLLDLEKRLPNTYQLQLFFTSLNLFYHAVSIDPLLQEPYHCQAAFWERIGMPDMGRRLLRSLNYASQQPVCEHHRSLLQEEAPKLPDIFSRTRKIRRVLFLIPPEPNYGLDVLYDGLCDVLDDENVVDFPSKPTLHGDRPLTQANYPCMFLRKSQALPPDEIVERLDKNDFDIVLYGDVRGTMDAAGLPHLLRRVAAPIVLVDQEDTPVDHSQERTTHVGVRFALQFKREKLSGIRYAARTYPLPFAFPESYLPQHQPVHRERTVFWAGHRMFGLRRLYLEYVEQQFGLQLDRLLPPDQYALEMLSSQIGLSFFGFGFDTVRYWEIPAHGCMLLAERPPIEIPENFKDGESAVFFDDLPELSEKLEYYLAHPSEVQRIAEAGHRLLRRHHTGKARAEQMLARIERYLF